MDKRFYFFKGRVALYALLKAFDIKPGDRILIPGYTCVVVPNTIKFLGAIPEYADIDPVSYNVPLFKYQETYSRLLNEKKLLSLKAIIIQHTYGNPNIDTENITKWAHEKKLLVIEDCAHINGVNINGKLTGCFGDGAFFSTQWNKPYTTGLGGYAILNNNKYFKKMKELEKKAISPGLYETIILTLELITYKIFFQSKFFWSAKKLLNKFIKIGILIGSSYLDEIDGKMPQKFFKKMGIFQKIILLYEEKKMDKINNHRIWLTNIYDRLLSNAGFPVFKYNKEAILIKYPINVKNREECLAKAKKLNIELGEWFNNPLHPKGFNLNGLNWSDENCPNSVKVAKKILNLPLHNRINEKKAIKIINFISNYLLK